MTTDSTKHDSIELYELSRENRSLMLSLKDNEIAIANLKLEILRLENGHIELVVKLQNANEEISRLTVKLEDANNEIGRLGMVIRREIDAQEAYNRLTKRNPHRS